MKELSKERIQQIWDYELISAWDEKGWGKMWKVVHKFMCRVKGEHELGSVGFEDAEDYLVSLGLKRCLDINHSLGHHVFQSWKSDVIGFIHFRCESLSNALMDGEPKPLILIDIDSYKWTKRSATGSKKQSRESSKRSYAKKVKQATVFVKARRLSSDNWDKVS